MAAVNNCNIGDCVTICSGRLDYFGVMTELIMGGISSDPAAMSPGSVRQLRREAAKARVLADNAFAEDERRSLQEVASSLDREAAAIEAALRLTLSRTATHAASLQRR